MGGEIFLYHWHLSSTYKGDLLMRYTSSVLYHPLFSISYTWFEEKGEIGSGGVAPNLSIRLISDLSETTVARPCANSFDSQNEWEATPVRTPSAIKSTY
jgi:hypothetical protein